jgi:hypothetical protein
MLALFFIFSLLFGETGLWTQGKAGALPLEPHLQSILLWLFLEMGVSALNCDPPDLSLPSSWDYRREPLHRTQWLFA